MNKKKEIVVEEEGFKQASKQDVDAVLEAIQELTKITGDLVKEFGKWRAAGRF